MEEIQTAADRKQVCVDAEALQDVEAAEAKVKQDTENHWLRVITGWCNTEVESPSSVETELELMINSLVDSAVLDGWEATLTSKGYIITRENRSFKISLPVA